MYGAVQCQVADRCGILVGSSHQLGCTSREVSNELSVINAQHSSVLWVMKVNTIKDVVILISQLSVSILVLVLIFSFSSSYYEISLIKMLFILLNACRDHGDSAHWLMEECNGSELYHGRVQ